MGTATLNDKEAEFVIDVDEIIVVSTNKGNELYDIPVLAHSCTPP